jgi:hypothetical protein
MEAALDNLRIVAAGVAVLMLPGLAWTTWFPIKNVDILEYLSDVVGLSVATTALVGLATFFLGWRFSAVSISAFYLGLFFICLAGITRQRFGKDSLLGSVVIPPEQSGEFDNGQSKRSFLLNRSGMITVISLVILLLLIAWRLYQAREIILPAWVDSVHHVLITRVILENGGVPRTLDPYLPVPLYYHFPFHALAAVFSFLSRLSPDQAVLWLGQGVNALIALSVYRLGKVVWGDSRRAGLAAIFVGFVSHMPAYYLTWGRYTLSLGVVLLPLVMAAALEIYHQGAEIARNLRLVLLTAGLLVVHYFAALLLALFLIILLTVSLFQDLRRGSFLRGNKWVLLAALPAAGALLVSPWLLHVWSFVRPGVNLNSAFSMQVAESLYFPNYGDYIWRLLGPNHNYLLLTLALGGLVIAFFHPRSRVFAAWSIALVVSSLPVGLQISQFRPDHSAIVLFIPASLLSSNFLLWIEERLSGTKLREIGNVILGIAIALIVVWGISATKSVINPATLLVKPADLKAIQWVMEYTPKEARFFINVTPWQNQIYRGVDGGWWISPLTGRQTLLPPVLYMMGEKDYRDRVNGFAHIASQLDRCDEDFTTLLAEADLTHVYVRAGERGISPGSLVECPGLSLAYAQDGVFIYQLNH